MRRNRLELVKVVKVVCVTMMQYKGVGARAGEEWRRAHRREMHEGYVRDSASSQQKKCAKSRED